jgi:hypothetical protein
MLNFNDTKEADFVQETAEDVTKIIADARYDDGSRDAAPGMTLRDYFAAAAMQGHIAAGVPSDVTYRDIADKAYRAADAMIGERKI